MTCSNVVAISDRADPVSWRARDGFGPAHRNNLVLRKKKRPLLWGRSFLCVSRSFIDRLVLSPKGRNRRREPQLRVIAEPRLPWRGRSGSQGASGWVCPRIKSPLGSQA